MKKLIILGASILQVPAIKKAKEMGLYVIALDMDPDAIGFKYAHEYHIISTIDIDGVLELAKKIKPDGIMTLASDKPMLTVAKVGEELGLNTISTETSVKVTNKARMREALQKRNVPIPKFRVVNNREEYLEGISQFNNKFIVKPADSSGSRGIFLVENIEQAEEAYEYSLRYSSTGEVLIEEYMEGPEVSVECITVDGETEVIAITDKYTTGSPHFIELGHNIPSILSEDIKKDIKITTKKAIKALGIEVGPSHTEIKVTSKGAKIVEVGARLGGDNITTHLVPLATGIDIVEKSIKVSIGRSTTKKQRINEAAAIRYMTVDNGTIKGIFGLESAIKIKGVQEIKITKGIGEKIEYFSSSTDRVGFIICKANNVDNALKLCKEVEKIIKIKVI
ncbi:ATP-grasp domain-containing protein [Romboutsia sp.]|uniref:ATP-grasp domain-containing protein n=1 Tax=Romboutsia sp. TaxID=1965302 RepID=UPI003F415EBE